MKAGVSRSAFGALPNGSSVEQYTLTNTRGMTVKVITYGGIITQLHAPDRHGNFADVVIGFDTLEEYLRGHPYFGALVGRFANRIAKGRFTLNGKTHTLAINNGPNHLHGGLKGFDKVLWRAEVRNEADGAALKLSYTSPDGEEGYPGTLAVNVTYTLTNDNELRIRYEATTDQTTPINLTNHSYWNLAGGGPVLGHELTLSASRFTPSDDTLIPTGEIRAVSGTPFDFTRPKPVGRDIEQLANTAHRGYDHNFVLDSGGQALALAARLFEPKSGRAMEVFTDQPGLQLYTANFLEDTRGKSRLHQKHGALCLETQHFPDSVNHPHFPSTLLHPGETFRTQTIYRFSTKFFT